MTQAGYSDITEEEYIRENNNIQSPLSEDMLIEQGKNQQCKPY
ncbi:hypothetical protein [Methanobrevibacter sp.]|nr:hypothetical protein [Methanobrevibacter sp.]MDO5824067.1 hypothetical protein [Methanobrevibacter sp.]